jgi:eukaryotic-like serine/threonine-protein kinase
VAESLIPQAQVKPPSSEGDLYAQRVGSVIKGKWRIDALLGVGGMAAVYAASHRNGQRAALKILHLDFAKDKAVCERFLREAYVSNKINHPACVSVLDDDATEQEEPFLVMELLEGETLRELWMKTGKRMPIVQVLQIMDPILDCLASCHALGVIHRDLKPANIFITSAGQVKVLDFGVAQFRSATAERTATGTALGTPSYMSPEQAMGLVDQLDGRADLFSVGAMIHALVTGHRINKGRTENEALIMAATTPVASVSRLMPDLAVEVIKIIDKALAWDRRNRFESAKAMQAAVRAAIVSIGGEDALPREAPSAPHPQVKEPSLPSAQASRSAASAAVAPVAIVPEAPPAPVEDPRLNDLRDLFKRVDRLLPNVRTYGWQHPATERSLRTAFEGFAEVLRQNPRAVEFAVKPFELALGGHTVWEPSSPFDAVPYNLFACGLRTMRLKPGVTMDELHDLLALMLLEPGRDLPPEDDIATALWEKALPHVEYDVADAFAEGDAAEREAFYNESDEMEKLAGDAARNNAARLEAKVMAISTDEEALRAQKRPSPMGLDDVVRAVYASQLEQPGERWSDRYVDVIIEGLIDAAKNKDAQAVLASLRRSASDLVVAGRIEVITALHQAFMERIPSRLPAPYSTQLAGALTNALFGAETLELMLKRLQAEPNRVGVFEPVLATLSQKELPTVLGALKNPLPKPLLDALLRYVERVLPGKEAEVGAAAAGLDTDAACLLVSILARTTTPAARQALLALAQSEDVAVRVEAKVLAAGNPDAAQADLLQMCENASPFVRLAALRAAARHQVKGVFPTVVRLVKQPNFHDLGSDERQELLRTLLVLSPENGEPIALEIAKKGGVFVSEAREASRVAAVEALGHLSRSQLVAAALREIAQARWGTSDETRNAANTAADLVARRSGGPS